MYILNTTEMPHTNESCSLKLVLTSFYTSFSESQNRIKDMPKPWYEFQNDRKLKTSFLSNLSLKHDIG